jgi:hypothetical protein
MITVHADVVGSLLRPPELIEARIRLAAGEIDASRFRGIGLEKCTGSLCATNATIAVAMVAVLYS